MAELSEVKAFKRLTGDIDYHFRATLGNSPEIGSELVETGDKGIVTVASEFGDTRVVAGMISESGRRRLRLEQSRNPSVVILYRSQVVIDETVLIPRLARAIFRTQGTNA